MNIDDYLLSVQTELEKFRQEWARRCPDIHEIDLMASDWAERERAFRFQI